MNKAVEYAKQKIAMFPDVYKDYINDLELFQMLVEDCRRQIEFETFSENLLKMGGGRCEQSVV